MSERRYSDEEVAAIFATAAESSATLPVTSPKSDGLTLTELHEIGTQVGISREAISMAARGLSSRPAGSALRFLGLPIGLERTVPLARPLTDTEWERLVVELRETFQAKGVTRSSGSLREWTNGNLQVVLEPTASGYRLRMRTIKGSSRNYMMMGLGLAGFAAAIVVGSSAAGLLGRTLDTYLPMLAIGAGLFGVGALQVPFWSRTRANQMEDIARRVTQQLLAEPSPPPTPVP